MYNLKIAKNLDKSIPPKDHERSRKLYEPVNNALFYCSFFMFTPNFFAKSP
jgi:hypothetical protein